MSIDLKEAIKKFHKAYYAATCPMEVVEAAGELFDAAGITSSLNTSEKCNAELINECIETGEIPKEQLDAYKKIEEESA